MRGDVVRVHRDTHARSARYADDAIDTVQRHTVVLDFEPQEVEVVRSAGDLSIITGLAEGTPIVVQGAFFVQSELQKSGFDIHDH